LFREKKEVGNKREKGTGKTEKKEKGKEWGREGAHSQFTF